LTEEDEVLKQQDRSIDGFLTKAVKSRNNLSGDFHGWSEAFS